MPTTYAIIKGNQYMDATLYTGTGTTNTITNAAGFKPDFVWGKSRSAVQNNGLYDSVRGVNNLLISNSTLAELVVSGVSSFNSNGFSTGSDGSVNQSAVTYVGWQWAAGQGSNVTNTSGTITSTVSANTTAGFSIVKFNTTSASGTSTIGHGLGAVPSMIIMKDMTTAYNWDVWNSGLGSIGNTLILNSTAAVFTTRQPFTTTAPTSSVFSFNNAFYAVPSDNVVAYCWTPIAGFSQFGSYTGNGSTDGPFIYLGFRPKFWMAKRTDVGAPWLIYDSSRNTSNVVNNYLLPNASDAEGSGSSPNDVNDFLSNGFKVRCSNAGENANGGNYIYMAFAETPFKYAGAR